MVREDIVRQRLDVLQNALADLRRYRERFSREQFLSDHDAQHMVLHALYIAAQASIDLALHAVADAAGTTPATYQDAFPEAARLGLIDAALAPKLSGWAGLRNVLAHHYPVVDYGKVHDALRGDLVDLESFAAAAARWLDR